MNGKMAEEWCHINEISVKHVCSARTDENSSHDGSLIKRLSSGHVLQAGFW